MSECKDTVDKVARLVKLQERIHSYLKDRAVAYENDALRLAEFMAEWQAAVDDYMESSGQKIKLVVNRGD